MTNILFISPQPVFGGAATANISIAKMLKNEGFHIIYNDEYMVEDFFLGMPIDHTPLHRVCNKNRNLLDFIRKKAFSTIIWGDVSLFVYFLPAIRALHKQGIKQFAVFHSLCLEKNVKSFIIEHIISFSLKYIDKFVFVSNYTRKSWSKYSTIYNNPDKLVSIHNPMEIPNFIRTFDSTNVRVGYVGRFSVEKQPSVFCNLSKYNSYHYVAFGEGPLLEEMKSKYPQISFNENCKNTDEIYSNIDVLVMTSKFENCPMVILEAKARGIPCVVPNVGGIPEIVSNGIDGILYEHYDSIIILDAISKIIGDYNFYSCNCLEQAKKTDPEVLVNKWKKIL